MPAILEVFCNLHGGLPLHFNCTFYARGRAWSKAGLSIIRMAM
jgi:hypothetical protein